MEFVIYRMLESLFEKSQPPSSLYSLTTPHRSTFQPWIRRSEEPSEYSHISDAISCGGGGIIALPPVFESDQPKYCRAVLELVTMEEKQDFDLETEKVFRALQAADLRINLQPRLRPECFSRDQRAELTEIANVTGAVCQTHRLPLALTWIPCDYTWGAVDGISKLRVRLRDSRMIRKCVFFIERTSCYADEEMQDFVHACDQLFMHSWQGAAGRAFIKYLPSFEPDVKENHVSEYPLAHHAPKYNSNAAVAIWLRGSDADYNYILEFFLPILMKESSEQQDLVGNLKLTLRKTCKSLRMFSKRRIAQGMRF
ncbi:protein NLP9 [Populus alba x Populus x berolinensis]|nr:protein NLP9 [Populus alba x Populus x berolinensis]